MGKVPKDVNDKIKKFCEQKEINYIDNSNITEKHLGMKRLRLNSKVAKQSIRQEFDEVYRKFKWKFRKFKFY